MQTIGLLPSQKLASLNQDDKGNWLAVPQGQSVVPLTKIAKPSFDPATQTVDPKVVWFADHAERQWTIRSLTSAELAAIADATTRTTAKATIKQLIPALRQWSADAASANTNWAAWTQAQKNAALQTVIVRFGNMADRLADLIQTLNLDK